jgi:isopentenyl-diphosphate delta-isomerase
MRKLEMLVRHLGVPVILKETGCGFSPGPLQRLRRVGIGAIDVSGMGGTHWGRIEGARAGAASRSAQIAATFADWGESIVDSVIAAKTYMPETEIWASGGVRTGLDAAKLIALGAHRVGFAKPALEAALLAGTRGETVIDNWMEQIESELRVALFCTGSASPELLRLKWDGWKYANSK